MAGLYADIPFDRMPWDRDGSLGYFVDPSSNVTQLTPTQMAACNDETIDSACVFPNFSSSYGFIGIMFPQNRDLQAYFLSGVFGGTNSGGIQYSLNTVTGADGTWTQWGSSTAISNSSSTMTPNYRTSVVTPTGASTVSGIKAVRFSIRSDDATNTKIYALHLFGIITAGQTPDRLRTWHPTLDQPLSQTPAALDFGDTQRTLTYTKTLRIKNNSSTLTANTITIGLEEPTAQSPTALSQMAISTDGGSTWGSTGTISSLAPGAISSVVTIRKVKASNAQLGLDTQRVYASAATWS